MNANLATGVATGEGMDMFSQVNRLTGSGFDDVLTGNSVNNLMSGGAGADTFVILAESTGGSLETDFIHDFNAAEGDRVDLSAIDANTLLSGDQGFSIVNSVGSGYGEMVLVYANGQTTLRLYTNGDKTVDYQIRMDGDHRGLMGPPPYPSAAPSRSTTGDSHAGRRCVFGGARPASFDTRCALLRMTGLGGRSPLFVMLSSGKRPRVEARTTKKGAIATQRPLIPANAGIHPPERRQVRSGAAPAA